MATAGIIVIGNEILSGKVEDANSPFLCRELRSLGVDVLRVAVIPDDVETIAEEVRAASKAFDYVFTTGGVGPTHDDLTMDGIARAFGREIEENASIVARITRAQGREPTGAQRKMACVPRGSTLLDAGDLWFPVVVVQNVHIFPGIPKLLQRKFHAIRSRFRGVPYLLRRVYVRQRESDIAEALHEVLGEFPELVLGSYPRVGSGDFQVLLTLESRDEDYLGRALERLLARLPGDAVVRVE